MYIYHGLESASAGGVFSSLIIAQDKGNQCNVIVGMVTFTMFLLLTMALTRLRNVVDSITTAHLNKQNNLNVLGLRTDSRLQHDSY